jgi:hypothetical protein
VTDLAWILTLSADALGMGLGLLAAFATLGAGMLAGSRGHRFAAACFFAAALLYTPGLALVNPLTPDPTEAVAAWLNGPAPRCGPEMCGTMCMHMVESWLDDARNLLWRARTVSDLCATGLLVLGFRLR